MPSALRSGGGSLLSSVPGRRRGRAAERDVQRLAVRADLDAARTLAERGGRHDRLRGGVDHGQVAGGLVGDEDANRRDDRRGRRRRGRAGASGFGGVWPQPAASAAAVAAASANAKNDVRAWRDDNANECVTRGRRNFEMRSMGRAARRRPGGSLRRCARCLRGRRTRRFPGRSSSTGNSAVHSRVHVVGSSAVKR